MPAISVASNSRHQISRLTLCVRSRGSLGWVTFWPVEWIWRRGRFS